MRLAGDTGAVDAEGALGRCVEAAGGDLLAAVVALPVAAFVELYQRALDPLLDRLQLLSHPYLGEAVDRLRRSLADPLAERDVAAALRRLRQLCDLSVDLSEPLAQRRLDCGEIQIVGRSISDQRTAWKALNSSFWVWQPVLPKVNFISPFTLFVSLPTTLI